jgi:hypothetical protein
MRGMRSSTAQLPLPLGPLRLMLPLATAPLIARSEVTVPLRLASLP